MAGPLVRVVLITVAVFLAGVVPGAAQEKTLVVGSLLELTGPFSPTAPAMGKATKLAVDEANKAARVAGLAFTVKQESADTQGDFAIAR